MRLYLIIFIFFVLLSCQFHNDSKVLNIEVNSSESLKYNLSEIFIKKAIVKLEKKETILLSTIQQLAMINNNIFILDHKLGVLRFNAEGKFINFIGSKGHGPGEYTAIQSFTVDTVKQKVYIAAVSKILEYDYTGKYLKSFSITNNMSYVRYLTIVDSQLISINDVPGLTPVNGKFYNKAFLYLYNYDYKIADSILLRSIGLDNVFFTGGGDQFYVSSIKNGNYIYYPVVIPESTIRDTLYKLEGMQLIPSIKLDFSTDLKIRNNVVLPNGRKLSNVKNVDIYNFYRSNRYVFAEYSLDSTRHLFCYDLVENKGYNKIENINDDIFGINTPKRIRPVNLSNEEFYFIKYGYELDGIVDSVDENSNPVIFFLKTKE
jgi:hypothetical protein